MGTGDILLGVLGGVAILLGRVVRKPVNTNARLEVNQGFQLTR